MVEYFKLDKVFVQGTTYEMPNDRFYVIGKIGTNGTDNTYLKIDGVDTGAIIADVAPMHEVSSNWLGPLSLEKLFYVVPPNKKFWVEGPAGAKMRCIGLIGKLSPGEGTPADLITRFAEQGKHYYTYVRGTKSLGVNEVWKNGQEIEIFSITPKTIERMIFNHYIGVSITGGAVTEGDFGIVLNLDGTPLDILTSEPGKKGIDVLSMPRPPAENTESIAFYLADLPIEVLGDHTFSVKAINVSGADKAPATGSSWAITLDAIVEYIKS